MASAAITLAEISAEWLAARREVIVRDGYALRAGAAGSIEIKSLTTNEWLRLALPGDTGAVVSTFATVADRDAVLRQLQEGA